MVGEQQILSSRVNVWIFDSISSGTASMTGSGSRAASSTDPAYSSLWNAESASGGTHFAQLHSLVSLAGISCFSFAQGVWKQVLQDGSVAAERGSMGDAAPHDAGADDRNRPDLRHYFCRLLKICDGRIHGCGGGPQSFRQALHCPGPCWGCKCRCGEGWWLCRLHKLSCSDEFTQ